MRIAIAALLLLQAGAVARTGIQGVVVGAGADPQTLLANARVELLRFQPGPNNAITDPPRIEHTDSMGRFAFANVNPGQYRLRVTREQYLRKEYGEFGLDEPGRPISIPSGQRLEVRIVLDPAPTVTGRISDEQGEGIPNVLVSAYRATYDSRGARRIVPEFTAQTDDHGDYRLYWIDPGEYYIGADIIPDPIFDNPNEQPPLDGYTTTYYPGLTDPAGVDPIRLKAGTEASGIDFRLTRDVTLREKRVTLRGNVMLDRMDLPGRSRITMESNGNVSAMLARDEQTGADGSFEIRGVEPGDYMLVAQAVRTIRGGGGRETGFVRVVVRNQDVENIRIVPGAGVRLDGRLSIEGAGPVRDGRDFPNTRVELTPVLSTLPIAASGALVANGGFTVDRFYLGSEYTVNVSGLPGDLYLKSARLGGADVLENGVLRLNFQSASDLLEMMLGADGGSLKGTVYNKDSDQPVPRAKVVLVPELRRRRRLEQYRVITADDTGNFILRGIPPGPYSLFAWRKLESNAYLNADFLSSYEMEGLPLGIVSGENKPVGLRAIPDR
jgi:protocatechuate 3,4-dioxygenase beta subunit